MWWSLHPVDSIIDSLLLTLVLQSVSSLYFFPLLIYLFICACVCLYDDDDDDDGDDGDGGDDGGGGDWVAMWCESAF